MAFVERMIVVGYGRAPPLYRAATPLQLISLIYVAPCLLFHFLYAPAKSKRNNFLYLFKQWMKEERELVEWIVAEAALRITNYSVIKNFSFYEGGSQKKPFNNLSPHHLFLFYKSNFSKTNNLWLLSGAAVEWNESKEGMEWTSAAQWNGALSSKENKLILIHLCCLACLLAHGGSLPSLNDFLKSFKLRNGLVMGAARPQANKQHFFFFHLRQFTNLFNKST